jgi:3-hydroxyacyl-[acyl-carrier-protein] dehydratase
MMNIEQIKATLPHRYPMLLIDRVLEIERGVRVEAIKNVSANEPFFQGHFPHNPIMPGVLIAEVFAQAAGILVIDAKAASSEGDFLLLGMDKMKFRKPVVPGDQLRVVVTKTGGKRQIWTFGCEAYVGGERVADGQIMATIT